MKLLPLATWAAREPFRKSAFPRPESARPLAQGSPVDAFCDEPFALPACGLPSAADSVIGRDLLADCRAGLCGRMGTSQG